MGEEVTVTVEGEESEPAPVDSGDTVVVAPSDSGNSDAMVGVATAVGALTERIGTLEARIEEIAASVYVAQSTAEVATEIATEAVTEASNATEEAVEAATDAAEEIASEDDAPEREHPFFRPAPWKRNRSGASA